MVKAPNCRDESLGIGDAWGRVAEMNAGSRHSMCRRCKLAAASPSIAASSTLSFANRLREALAEEKVTTICLEMLEPKLHHRHGASYIVGATRQATLFRPGSPAYADARASSNGH